MLGAAGMTPMELAFWTFTVSVWVTEPTCAFTVAVPDATPVTNPLPTTVAMEPSLGVTLHVTPEWSVWWVPSLKLPIADKKRPDPVATPTEGAGNAIDVSDTEPLTLREADPVIPPRAASIIVEPAETPVAVAPAIVATGVFVLVQLASAVISCVVPSLNFPTAE
jgi:hypothetical protein